MTTAHKPTWKPAVGMSEAKGYIPSKSYSSRDLPGYLDLKERKWGQGSVAELKERDFKAQLLKREAEINNNKLKNQEEQKMITQGSSAPDFLQSNKAGTKILKPGEKAEPLASVGEEDNPFPEDQDSESFVQEKPEVDYSDSESDDEELLKEFQRVKQQREMQQRQRQQQKARYSASNRESELLKGNPLVQGGFSLSKRWYQDTVFKNQAKRVEQKKCYVNDHIRSEFHRKFINKYVMR